MLGAGTVGLLVAAMARVYGASKIVIADIDQGRLDFAVEHSFADIAHIVKTKKGDSIDEDLKIAKETAMAIALVGIRIDGEMMEFDAVFECTGVPSCAQTAIYVSHFVISL